MAGLAATQHALGGGCDYHPPRQRRRQCFSSCVPRCGHCRQQYKEGRLYTHVISHGYRGRRNYGYCDAGPFGHVSRPGKTLPLLCWHWVPAIRYPRIGQHGTLVRRR